MQLDIFDDSRDVMLRNDVAEALARGDRDAAIAALALLREHDPADWAHAPASVLLEALAAEASRGPFATADNCLQPCAWLEQQVTPAAARLLAEAADAWLAQRWRQLAACAAPLAWSARQADAHAAALWLRAGAWAEAAAAVERIESWRRIPAPLAWMAQARWHTHGPNAAWPLLVELAWLAPERGESLVRQLADGDLDKRLRRFDLDFAELESPWPWFPAWLAIDHPAFAPVLDAAQAGAGEVPEQGFRLVQALLRLERQGRHHEVVEHRKRLLATGETLFRCYMRTR